MLADGGVVRTLKERYGSSGSDLDDAEGGHLIPTTAGTLGANEEGPRYDLDGHGAYIPYRKVSRDGDWAEGVNPLRARDHKGDSQVIVFAQNQRDELRELDVAGALAAEPGMKQQTFLAYNVYPAGGQGADLEAKETDRAMTLSALNGQGHDRGTRIVQGVDLYNQTLTGDQHVPLRTAGGHGAPAVLTTAVRRLTPLECERLQGFPDHWTDTQSDTQRYRQMGNAVAVPVAEWIMRRIMEED